MYEFKSPEEENARFRRELKTEVTKTGLNVEQLERVLGVFLGDEEGGGK